jgi:D-alanyl-D-alanine carboxypeptidase
VALSLVSKGKLSLQDTIGERLRELLPEAWWEVTLRQLLNHTSGIPDLLSDPGVQKALQASPTKAPPPEELLSLELPSIGWQLFVFGSSRSDSTAS